MMKPANTLEIEAVTQAWARHFNTRQAGNLAALYDRTAVLWGTVSSEIITTPEGIRQYFDAVCASPVALHVTFDEQIIRTCGDAMLNAGRYTFTFEQEGRQQTFRARFSMTLLQQDGKWLILDHHSSELPRKPGITAQ